jgi:hypothetical protein
MGGCPRGNTFIEWRDSSDAVFWSDLILLRLSAFQALRSFALFFRSLCNSARDPRQYNLLWSSDIDDGVVLGGGEKAIRDNLVRYRRGGIYRSYGPEKTGELGSFPSDKKTA